MMSVAHCLDCNGVKPRFSNSASHCPMLSFSGLHAKAMSLIKHKASNASGEDRTSSPSLSSSTGLIASDISTPDSFAGLLDDLKPLCVEVVWLPVRPEEAHRILAWNAFSPDERVEVAKAGRVSHPRPVQHADERAIPLPHRLGEHAGLEAEGLPAVGFERVEAGIFRFHAIGGC